MSGAPLYSSPSPPPSSSSSPCASPHLLSSRSSSAGAVHDLDDARVEMLCKEEFGFDFSKLEGRIHQLSEALQSMLNDFPEDLLKLADPADRRNLAKAFILRILEINQRFTDRTIRALLKTQSAFLENVQKENDLARSELARCEEEADLLKVALQCAESEKGSIESEARERFEEEKAILEVSLREQLQACQICELNPRNVVIMPCLHGQYCADCLEGHQKTNTTCPTCRGVIRCTIPYIA